MSLASIPSPSQGVWHLGPLPVRGYALMIILGVIVAVWLGEQRWRARGGSPGVIVDVAVWAVPFGLVGGRIYHVITDWQLYFGDDTKTGERNDPMGALAVWDGGLGIWGAVALGGVGAWIACRQRGASFLALADASAPGVALAQAIGRWGNWFNQELYGRGSDLPWAVEIDPDNRPHSTPEMAEQYRNVATYHPTFLYESLWCVGVAVLVIWAGKRYKLSHGRVFALYVAGYTVGRFWIESLRLDTAHEFAGLRLNDWTSIAVFLAAVAYLYLMRGKSQDDEVLEPGLMPAVPDDAAAEDAVPDDAAPEDAAPDDAAPDDAVPEDDGDKASDKEK